MRFREGVRGAVTCRQLIAERKAQLNHSVNSAVIRPMLSICVTALDCRRLCVKLILIKEGRVEVTASGYDKMRSRADLRGGTPLVSFSHVIDPHFVTLSSSFYTTSRKPNP